MDITPVTVELREDTGKGVARKLRAAGRVPGIVYGVGQAAQAISFDRHMFDTLMRKGSHHGILKVVFDDGRDVTALAREIQIHPVSRQVLHVDLQRVDMTKKVQLNVQIFLVGKPIGVKNQGGILEHNLREVEIECLPTNIPEALELDVSALEVGDSLHVSDLKMEGIEILGHPETTVAQVSLPAAERSAEEIEEEAAAAASAEGGEGAAEADGDKGDKKDDGDGGS